MLGTLLGSFLTYSFQRMTLRRTLTENRNEKRREEFANAVATYASAATALRRAEYNRAKKRIERVADSEREEARQETYRLRAETQSAYYLVRLLANPDTDNNLLREAENVIERSRRITAGPKTIKDLDKRRDEATTALDRVVDMANGRLRAPSF